MRVFLFWSPCSTVRELIHKFRNVILCEDIRDELGGKHSLMGVFSGDITIPAFPVTMQLAAYMQYEADQGFEGEMDFAISIFLDDRKLVGGVLRASIKAGDTLPTIILPKGLFTLDQPATYRLVVTVEGRDAEVLSKKIMLGAPVTPPNPLPPS
jgi:hypothetical protein